MLSTARTTSRHLQILLAPPIHRLCHSIRCQARSMADTWNERYKDPNRYAYGVEPNAFIKDAGLRYLPAGQPKHIAELASGEGRNVVFLAQLGHHVSAVDFSSSGLDKTRLLANQQGCDQSLISYHLADVITWQPTGGNKLDAVIMSFCHIPKDLKPQFFANLQAILKPGGLVIVEVFHPDQIAKGYRAQSGGPPDPTMMFTVEELRDLLKEGQELESAQVEYVLKEGPLHDGKGAVTRYVWRKNT